MTDATLTPLEQKIYFAAKNAVDEVIFLETIRSWNLTDDNTLLSTISNMCKKGWLLRLRNGVYLVKGPGRESIQDPFIISTYIFPGYNAFSCAMYLHKLTDVLPFEIFIASRNESSKKTIGQYTFHSIALGKRHSGSMLFGNYRISTIPKTIYDCMIHPELAGGYPAVLKAIFEADLSQEGWREFFYYAEIFEGAAFFQRVGYLLDILPKKNSIVKKVIRECLNKVRSKIYLQGRSSGEYISKWMLIDNVGKEALLSWWY